MIQARTVLGRLALGLGLAAGLGGCPLAIVAGLGAAGGAGYAANQERGVGGTVNDFTIKTNIENAWNKTDPNLLPTNNVTVYEGRVLLTGTAADQQRKDEAAQIAKTIPGVRVVYNEIQVRPAVSSWRSTKDAWVASEVKSSLVFSDVRSVNYTIETVDGSVYLIGSARSQAELDHATNLARRVGGVKRVVSYVEVRPGTQLAGPAAAPPTPLTTPSGLRSQPPGGAAPTTPVEVQKL